MNPAPGQTLSHYRLVEKIGEGGMGVVWKADDTVLNRSVAIKLLPADTIREEPRRKLFLQEAQMASSVSHAHIVQVYEFGREGDLDFIVMELVEGRALSKIMRGRPLPPHKVADYGHQVASALARAHSKGLIHRDLKPGNILVSPDGDVKVVDFGLATLFERRDTAMASTLGNVSQDITKSHAGQTQRTIAGTLPYMSPEQVRGEKLDGRSDIFSLGVVLYEMTTGSRPFHGRTNAELAAEIQKARPRPVHDMVSRVPFELDRAIEKCLAARPRERYQTMDDLAVDLKRLARDLVSGSSPSYEDLARRPLRRTRWHVVVAVTAVGAAIVAAALYLRPAQKRTMVVPAVHRQLTFTGKSWRPELSADGQFVALVQKQDDGDDQQLIVQDLAGGAPLEILRAHGISRHRWSPMGTELLVLTEEAALVVPRLGGTTRPQPRFFDFFAWSPDGKRYAAGGPAGKSIDIVDSQAGVLSSIPLGDAFTFLADIDWSPVGAYLALRTFDEKRGHAIWTIPSTGGTQTKVCEESNGITSMRWSGDGSSIYYLLSGQGTRELRKIRIDPSTGAAVSPGTAVMASLELSGISLSRDGKKLAYTRGSSDTNIVLLTLREHGRDKSFETKQLTSGTFDDSQSWLSPDRRLVAFVRGGDIHTVPTSGGPTRQLTFTKARKWSPAWSPDGAWIAFASSEGGTARVWKVPAQGGTARPYDKTEVSSGNSLTWAGSRIVYPRPGNRNLHVLDPNTEDETPLIKDESVGWVFWPELSPDGDRVAVMWNRSSPGGKGQGLWTISLTDSIERLVVPGYLAPSGWSADGAWIYAWDVERARLVKVSAGGGGVETVLDWPFEDKQGTCMPGPDVTSWICDVTETSSDVWLVENFDPDVK